MKKCRLAGAAFGVLVAGQLCLPPLAAAQIWTPQVIGEPSWKIADVHLFAGPTGTKESGFEEFFARAQAIMPGPNHRSKGQGVQPGEAHPPPYDHEIADGMAALGLVDAVEFTEEEFSAGLGVYFVFLAIPSESPAIGSSADFSSGPIIPFTLFPFHLVMETRKGAKILGALDYYPPDKESLESEEGDGYSHVPFFNADSVLFYRLVAPEGYYQYVVTLTDTAGNGWSFGADFKVGTPPTPVEPDAGSSGGEDIAAPDAGVVVGSPDVLTESEDTGESDGEPGDVAVSHPDAVDVAHTGGDAIQTPSTPARAEEAGGDGCSAAPPGWAPPTVFVLVLLGAFRRRQRVSRMC